jgi:tetratricopeptide (TPR) repeat protein
MMAQNTTTIRTDTLGDSLVGYDSVRADKRKETKSRWPTIRLVMLLCVLVPLSIFGFFRMRYTNAVNAIQRALVNHDDLKAVALVKELEKSNGMSAESCFFKARAYRHLGDDASFLQYLDLAAQLGYSPKKVANERTLRAAQLGELGPELETKMEVLMTDTDIEFDEVACSLVYGYLDANQIANVFPVLQLWNSQDKKTPWVPYFYGMIAQNQRDWAKSIEAFAEVAKVNPDFVPLYRTLGVSYEKLNDHDKAIAAFRRYLQSHPNDTEVLGMLSTSLISANQTDEGLEILLPFIESNTATDEMRISAAKIYMDRNLPQKAIDVVGSLSKLWPQDVAVASIMSQANQRLGNDNDAERFQDVAKKGQQELMTVDERIINLQKGIDTTAEKNYELGHILLHLRSREEGILWLKQAVAIDPKHIKSYEDIITYFTNTNQTEMAARYQQYLNQLKGTP